MFIKRSKYIRRVTKKNVLQFYIYDEKPGIQAIGNASPDLPPSKYSTWAKDYEYNDMVLFHFLLPLI